MKNIFRLTLFVLFCFMVNIGVATSGENTRQSLKDASSPYVAMHAADKIHWHSWDKQALQLSQRENKPLLLSIGYFSCYWCHVLQRESFNNDELASYINQHFIPVVVDREIHVSLDAYLTRFAEETIGRGGWPLNVIMTPDGYPLMATIYLPPKHFKRWLSKAAGLWAEDPNYIRGIAKDAADEMNMLVAIQPEVVNVQFVSEVKKRFLSELMSVADEFQGGFGDQAKFPLPAILEVLLSHYAKNNSKSLDDFLHLTLNNIASQGLFDHLQGGFFRYTTGPDWQLPHFEKMLYDNAQLASLYLHAGKTFDSKKYQQLGIDQLDYLIRRFQTNQGAYYASYSAVDEKGVEGGYYLWTDEELTALLSKPEQSAAFYYWGWDQPALLPEGRFPVPRRSIEQLASDLKTSETQAKKLIQQAKQKLLTQRNKRVLPRDEKILTSWNALMLIALIDGYETTSLPRFKMAAGKLAEFMLSELIVNGQLSRGLHKGQMVGTAELEDYAYTAMAFYRWWKLSDQESAKAYKLEALRLVDIAWKKFWNKSGWKMSDSMLIPNLSQETMIADGPLPSPSAMLIKLGFKLQDEKLSSLSSKALGYGHYSLKTAPFWYASYVDTLISSSNK